ncbi:MAG TPA: hypothetical protein VH079_19500 [Terriglobales bacterium]|jgi:hypothetical protein|nr:hypothetical protein [Terriglobales bacterium]
MSPRPSVNQHTATAAANPECHKLRVRKYKSTMQPRKLAIVNNFPTIKKSRFAKEPNAINQE